MMLTAPVYGIGFDLSFDDISGFFGKYFNYRINMEALKNWAGLGAILIFVGVPYAFHKMLFSLSRLPFLSDVAAGGLLLGSMAFFLRIAAFSAVFLLAFALWPHMSPWVEKVL